MSLSCSVGTDAPLYVPCPRCRGSRQVFAYTRLGNELRHATGEYFTCPLCHGTAEADREAAGRYIADQAEEED